MSISQFVKWLIALGLYPNNGVPATTAASRVYLTNGAGAQVTAVYSSVGTAGTMAFRDANGRSQFVDPAAAQDAATKNYVDTTSVGLANSQTVTGTKVFSGMVTFGGTMQQNASSAEQMIGAIIVTSQAVTARACNIVNATSGSIVITLPSAISAGSCRIMIMRVDAVIANTVTINAAGTDTINGLSSVSLNLAYESVILYSANAAIAGNWIILAKT